MMPGLGAWERLALFMVQAGPVLILAAMVLDAGQKPAPGQIVWMMVAGLVLMFAGILLWFGARELDIRAHRRGFLRATKHLID